MSDARRTWHRVARLWVAVTVLASLQACRHQSNAVPPELTGLWATTTPKYKDRNLEITPEFIIFWTGPRSATPHRITRVNKRWDEAKKSDLFEIEYSEQSERSTLRLHFIAAPEPVITFRNQPEIRWLRVAASSAKVD
jgi:hypothetical protein